MEVRKGRMGRKIEKLIKESKITEMKRRWGERVEGREGRRKKKRDEKSEEE